MKKNNLLTAIEQLTCIVNKNPFNSDQETIENIKVTIDFFQKDLLKIKEDEIYLINKEIKNFHLENQLLDYKEALVKVQSELAELKQQQQYNLENEQRKKVLRRLEIGLLFIQAVDFIKDLLS